MYPSVLTEIYVEKLNFTFCVRAYRKVTENEMRNALRFWMQSERRKKLPKNMRVEVVTIHGYND